MLNTPLRKCFVSKKYLQQQRGIANYVESFDKEGIGVAFDLFGEGWVFTKDFEKDVCLQRNTLATGMVPFNSVASSSHVGSKRTQCGHPGE